MVGATACKTVQLVIQYETPAEFAIFATTVSVFVVFVCGTLAKLRLAVETLMEKGLVPEHWWWFRHFLGTAIALLLLHAFFLNAEKRKDEEDEDSDGGSNDSDGSRSDFEDNSSDHSDDLPRY